MLDLLNHSNDIDSLIETLNHRTTFTTTLTLLYASVTIVYLMRDIIYRSANFNYIPSCTRTLHDKLANTYHILSYCNPTLCHNRLSYVFYRVKL